MAQLVPEKTVEVWTALAVVNSFDRRASVYTRGGDIRQAAWPDDLRQLFVLEPRVPELAPPSGRTDAEHAAADADPDSSVPCYRINRRQLDKFTWWYSKKWIPEVLYVLPDPRERPRSPDKGPLLPLAHHEVADRFPRWTRAIRASSLDKLIENRKAGQWARVHWAEDVAGVEDPIPGALCYRPHRGAGPRTVVTRPLGDLFEEIARAEEPPGVTMRAASLRPEYKLRRQQSEPGHTDIEITPEALSTVQRLINEQRTGYPLLVGIPWRTDDPLRVP